MLSKAQAVSKFNAFISSLSTKDKVAVLHHIDADGICSGALAAKALEKLLGKKIDLHLNQSYGEISVMNATIKMLKQKGISKVIITDLSVDSENAQQMKKLEAFAEILILDHHKIYAELNSSKTTFIKAQFISKTIEPGNYPASKLCYDLFSIHADLSNSDWIAAAGIIGDYSYEAWKDFVYGVNRKYCLNAKKPYTSDLKIIADCLDAVASVDIKQAGKAFDILYNADNPKEVLQNTWLKRQYTKIEKELNFWFDASDSRIESYPEQEIILYLIKPRHNIRGILINKLSRLKYADKTLIVVQDTSKEEIRFSARNQTGKIAVNDLLEDSVKGLKNASAGGHKKAAAGHIMRKDLKKWKERLIAIALK